MPCAKCNSDFTLFNWKIKCGECEDKYCNKCLRRKEGVLYCEVCLVLINRPPDRVKLMELRVKDLQNYLHKNKVSTHGMVEKDELVDLMCKRYIPEKQHRGVDKLTANFGDPLRPINGFFNNLESVITENRSRGRPTTVPAPPPPTPPTAPPPPPPEDQPTTSQVVTTPQASPLPQRCPKLEEIATIDELQELSSKQLKILLTINRVEFRGCIEKEELLERARRLWEDNQRNKDIAETVPVEDLCKLCMDAPLDCVLLECGHITTCIECGKKLAECPICRRYVVRVVRTFKA